MTGVLAERETQGRRPGEDPGRDRSDAASSPGTRGATIRRRGRTCCHLDFRLLASATGGELITTQFVVICYSGPRERNRQTEEGWEPGE